MNRHLRILFITRKYPPSVGGMERLSYQFVNNISKRAQVFVISWSGSRIGLPWFLMYALGRGLYLARKADVLHAGDPVVGPVVWFLGRFYHLPIVVNVHGLDLVFDFPAYRLLISRLLPRFHRIVCISRAVYSKALEMGLEPERCRVIHPGIDMPSQVPERDLARRYIENWLKKPLANRQIWLTVGRLVARKGVAWFCEQVLPRLRDIINGFIYLIVGTGPEFQYIHKIIRRFNLTNHVYLLGLVDDKHLSWLYSGADAFIMPNIPQRYDMEGFGIVALEAAAYGLPVIAARIDGIQDAVIEGESGYLLVPGDAEVWVNFLRSCLIHPSLLEDLRPRARSAVHSFFEWNKIIDSYMNMYYEIINDHSSNQLKKIF